MTSTKTSFLEDSIRKGFTSEDVRLWQALCRQCETDIGDSHKFMHFILDMATHNGESALQIIHTGRELSKQKAVNQEFINALVLAVCSDDEACYEDAEAATREEDAIQRDAQKVLDLTAEESSGSYETTGEDHFYQDCTPNSADAYEIDGFVVEDDEAPPTDKKKKSALKRTVSSFVETPAGAVALRKSSLKKRVLESISEDEE